MLRQLPTVVFEGQLAAMLHNLQRRLGLTFLRSFAQLPQHSVQERPRVGEEQPDEVLERGFDSEFSGGDDGCGLECAFD